MKKTPEDKELQKLWNENIGELAYDMEEAFLEVFKRKSAEFHKPAFYLGAIAMAAGHVLQVTEKEFCYEHDFKVFFDDVMKQAYDYSRQHPCDEDEDNGFLTPNIDTSMLN